MQTVSITCWSSHLGGGLGGCLQWFPSSLVGYWFNVFLKIIFIYFYIYLFIFIFIYLYIYLYIYFNIYLLFIYFIFIYFYIYLFTYLFIYLFIYDCVGSSFLCEGFL